ncbi:MAG: hypothetical protein Q9187_007577 [Circinaria calcarea]
MVQLEEVEDDELKQLQLGKEFIDDDDFTDTDSEISDVDDLSVLPSSESLSDRILALRDMVPPATRRRISSTSSTAVSYAKTLLTWGGKTLFVVSTSALMVGVPWALAFSEEQQFIEMEKEQKAREAAGEVS